MAIKLSNDKFIIILDADDAACLVNDLLIADDKMTEASWNIAWRINDLWAAHHDTDITAEIEEIRQALES